VTRRVEPGDAPLAEMIAAADERPDPPEIDLGHPHTPQAVAPVVGRAGGDLAELPVHQQAAIGWTEISDPPGLGGCRRLRGDDECQGDNNSAHCFEHGDPLICGFAATAGNSVGAACTGGAPAASFIRMTRPHEVAICRALALILCGRYSLPGQLAGRFGPEHRVPIAKVGSSIASSALLRRRFHRQQAYRTTESGHADGRL
jgi:hypothetical protein